MLCSVGYLLNIVILLLLILLDFLGFPYWIEGNDRENTYKFVILAFLKKSDLTNWPKVAPLHVQSSKITCSHLTIAMMGVTILSLNNQPITTSLYLHLTYFVNAGSGGIKPNHEIIID